MRKKKTLQNYRDGFVYIMYTYFKIIPTSPLSCVTYSQIYINIKIVIYYMYIYYKCNVQEINNKQSEMDDNWGHSIYLTSMFLCRILLLRLFHLVWKYYAGDSLG